MSNLLSDPTIPQYDHAVWCRDHDNGGRWDQVCSTVPDELTPSGHVPADPGTIRLAVFQPQVRADGDAEWTIETPRVLLQVWDERRFACSDVSLAEARRLAAGLLNAVELAETETARCAR